MEEMYADWDDVQLYSPNQPLMDTKQFITQCRHQLVHMFLDNTDPSSVEETGFLKINNPWYSKRLD